MKRIEIKWFKTCSTLDEVKRLYKTLSMLHHPDLGGNLRDMQEINVEFDEIKKNRPMWAQDWVKAKEVKE